MMHASNTLLQTWTGAEELVVQIMTKSKATVQSCGLRINCSAAGQGIMICPVVGHLSGVWLSSHKVLSVYQTTCSQMI